MRIRFGFLRTKVARRILFLFVLSAVLPVSVLSVLSYLSVRNHLLTETDSRLDEAAKNSGNALVERFQLLESRARLIVAPLAAGKLGGVVAVGGSASDQLALDDDLLGFDAAVVRYGEGSVEPVFGSMSEPPALSEAEESHLAEGLSVVRIIRDPDRGLEIHLGLESPEIGDSGSVLWTRLTLPFLWQTATAYSGLSENAGLCILVPDHAPLHCGVPEAERLLDAYERAGIPTSPDGEVGSRMKFEWRDEAGGIQLARARLVFLRPQFHLGGMEMVVTEPRSSALASMEGFQTVFWRVILVGLVVVALLSNVQIRKSMEPLVELRKGTQRLARGEFTERVAISSRDEFEDLAGSFNTMASDLESQFQALSTIGEIDRAILSALDADEILETALLRTKDLLACDRVTICRLDWLGAREGRIKVFDVPQGQLGSSQRVLLTDGDLKSIPPENETKVFYEADSASEIFGETPGEGAVVCAAMAPLRHPEGLAGFLAVGRETKEPFSDTDLARVQQMGKQISIALSNAWLVEELDHMSWGALTALARTVDAKSPWTSGHSENVSKLSVAIGRSMGLSESTLTGLQRGGLVHDIGKIAVPGAILDKPGRLSGEEYEIIRSHPQAGVTILEPVPGMESILPMVLHHHEAWDGSGYPYGLEGTEIPLEARVMAVADQFDALSSDRPYRKGLGLNGTIQFLKDQSGIGLDPDIVKVFLDLLEAGELPIELPSLVEAE